MLSRFLVVATTYFAAHTDYNLLEMRTCYQIARNPPRIPANQNGKTAIISVIPDAWLDIERVSDGSTYPLWLEIDRATENYQKFQQLVRNRLAFVKSSQYEQMFNTNAVLFCYVTTAATPELADIRLHNMLRWTEELLPRDEEKKEDEEKGEDKEKEGDEKKKVSERQQLAALFRFTTVDYPKMYEQPHTLFTQPVWYQPCVDKQVPLFDPINPSNHQETGHGSGETGTDRCRENIAIPAECVGHDCCHPTVPIPTHEACQPPSTSSCNT
jgi:hypothetical protein